MNTKKIILDNLEILLSKSSISEIRVQKICDAANVSKGTFYSYFQDKYDAANEYYISILNNAGFFDVKKTSYEERLYKLIEEFQKHSDFFLNRASENGQNSFMEFMNDEPLKILLNEIYSRYGINSTEQNNYIIRLLINAQTNNVIRWLYDCCPITKEELCKLLIDMEKTYVNFILKSNSPQDV